MLRHSAAPAPAPPPAGASGKIPGTDSAEIYRALAEAAPDMVFLLNPQGQVLYVNSVAARHLGRPVQDVIGRSLPELFPPEIAARYLKAVETVCASGQPFFAESPEVFQPSGRWIDTRLVPVHDEGGRIGAVLGFTRDISERKQAELGLQASEERYRRLFEESPVALWEEDFQAVKRRLDHLRNNGVRDFQAFFTDHPEVVKECAGLVEVLDVNQACLTLYRAASKEELLGGIDRTFSAASRALFRQELLALAGGATHFEGETETVSLSGETNYVAVRVYVAAGHERELSRVLVSMIDLTERKRRDEHRRRVQQLERANRDMDRFSRIVSRDLDQPLRLAEQNLQLLGRRLAGRGLQDAEGHAGYAAEGVRRLRGLLNDLLAYAQAGGTEWQLEPVDCDAALAEALQGLEQAVSGNGARISRDPLPTVLADRRQVVLLFRHLLDNAIKFRKLEEPPVVHVRADRRNADWMFAVRDNGIGIDAQDQLRLFEVFERAQSRSPQEGNGIGLAICRKIVERLGGRIWVTSAPGKGSIFSFTLPADPGRS
jgi:PAS domain S-box-containing protein